MYINTSHSPQFIFRLNCGPKQRVSLIQIEANSLKEAQLQNYFKGGSLLNIWARRN